MRIFNDFANLFFPNYCVVTGFSLSPSEEYLSTHIRMKLPYTNFHLDADNELYYRFSYFEQCYFAGAYLKYGKKGAVQKILQHLKYKNLPGLGEAAGRWYGAKLLETEAAKQTDLIIPVPLHLKKIRKRGYNQADYIAKGMAAGMRKPYNTKLLIKPTHNETQTNKNKFERMANVASVYSIKKPDKIVGKNIFLVDDVITTGATMMACGEILIKNGASNVGFAALAYAG